MEFNDVKLLKVLEEENAKLKKLFVEVSLENHAMKELFSKKLMIAKNKTCAQTLKEAGLPAIIKVCELTTLP